MTCMGQSLPTRLPAGATRSCSIARALAAPPFDWALHVPLTQGGGGWRYLSSAASEGRTLTWPRRACCTRPNKSNSNLKKKKKKKEWTVGEKKFHTCIFLSESKFI